jgi:hypothetical protein
MQRDETPVTIIDTRILKDMNTFRSAEETWADKEAEGMIIICED